MVYLNELKEALQQVPQSELPTRVIVRIDGRDVDISSIGIQYDGVLGTYVVINTEKLSV